MPPYKPLESFFDSVTRLRTYDSGKWVRLCVIIRGDLRICIQVKLYSTLWRKLFYSLVSWCISGELKFGYLHSFTHHKSQIPYITLVDVLLRNFIKSIQMEDAGSRLSKKIYKKRTNDTKKKPRKNEILWITFYIFLYITSIWI